MKKKNRYSLLVVIVLLCLAFLVSCTNKAETSPLENNKPKVMSDTLYVKKVENIPEDFILGMDASCVPSLEKSGVKYFDYDGTEKDVYEILSQNGINYIRVRIWNDPFDSNGNGYGGGNCNLQNAVEVGKRATKYGMKLLVNFHYSDFWADPGKQFAPKAWKNMTIDEKADALYQYTRSSLEELKKQGVDIGMVQIGNETNGAMCGESSSKADGWKNITTLMSNGAKAVRDVCPDALVAVHFTNPENPSSYEIYGKNLEYYGVDYDVFASSYYPYWHGTLKNLSTVLSDIATKYGKKVMVAETSYAFNDEDTDFYGNTVGEGGDIVKNYPFTIQGQTNSVRDVINTVVNDTVNGIGVFYWEGTWIGVGGKSYEENLSLWESNGSGWASSYAALYDPDDAGKWYGGCSVENQAFFDDKGKAIESLKVFALVRNGNELEIKPNAVESVNLSFDLNSDIVLPKTVKVIMTDNSTKDVSVIWHNADIDGMKNNGANKYTVLGTAEGMSVECYINMVEHNYLKNGSFEEGGVFWTTCRIKDFEQLNVEENPSNSLSGKCNYHFWGSKENSVEFILEQNVDNLNMGKYQYSVSVMGGDGGATEIYAYVKINGKIAYKIETKITSYSNWHTAKIPSFEYNGTDSLTVGIYVKCQGPNAWGKIDDALLNEIK